MSACGPMPAVHLITPVTFSFDLWPQGQSTPAL